MPKIAIYRGDQLHQEVVLSGRDLKVGRADENDVVLPDAEKALSRVHAEIRYKDGRYVIVDLGSQNGLWVAGRREAEVVLEPGRPVVLGRYMLVYSEPPAVEPPVPVADDLPETKLIDGGATLIPRAGSKSPMPAMPPPTPSKPASPDAAPPPTKPHPIGAAPVQAGKRRGTSRMLVAAVAVMAVLVFSIVALVLAGRARARRTEAAPPPAVVAEESQGPSNQSLRDEFVARARSALERRDYDAALTEIESALRAVPGDTEALELKRQAEAGKADAAKAAAPARPAAPRQTRPAAPARLPALSVVCRPGESRADCARRDREVTERYNRAKAALDGGAFEAAFTEFSTLVRDEPGYKDASLLLARARDGVRSMAQDALNAGARAESGSNWLDALKQYGLAMTLDASTTPIAEESIKRVRTRMSEEGAREFVRARQYDALGRTAEALASYERAVLYLPAADPNRQVAEGRVQALRGQR